LYQPGEEPGSFQLIGAMDNTAVSGSTRTTPYFTFIELRPKILTPEFGNRVKSRLQPLTLHSEKRSLIFAV